MHFNAVFLLRKPAVLGPLAEGRLHSSLDAAWSCLYMASPLPCVGAPFLFISVFSVFGRYIHRCLLYYQHVCWERCITLNYRGSRLDSWWKYPELKIMVSLNLWTWAPSSSSSVTQLCLIHCDPMDLPGSSVHWIFQARRLEWVAISYSRGSSQHRDWTCVSFISCISRQILYHWATWEAWGP